MFFYIQDFCSAIALEAKYLHHKGVCFQDNNVQMKNDLEKFLYHLRIEAEVFVIEMVSLEHRD